VRQTDVCLKRIAKTETPIPLKVREAIGRSADLVATNPNHLPPVNRRCCKPVVPVDDYASLVHSDGPVVLRPIARLAVRCLAGQLAAGGVFVGLGVLQGLNSRLRPIA
jgi:hypothetical protein